MTMRISLALLISAAGLAILPAPAQAQTEQIEAALAEARAFAKADQHAQSIAAFRRALALAPAPRADWLRELGEQQTWSNQLDDAIATFRQALTVEPAGAHRDVRFSLARALAWAGQHGAAISEYDRLIADDRGNLEARLARAEVLGWDDRLGKSLAAYRGIVADYPGDLRARRGVARTLSWRGRQRAAIEAAEAILKSDPDDEDTQMILADALTWMGRSDRASTVLRRAAAAKPDSARIAAKAAALGLQLRPEARLDVRLVDQSDDLRFDEFIGDTRFPVRDGRGYIGARFYKAVYRPARSAVRRISVERPAIYGGYRISNAIELSGAVSIDEIDTRGASGDHAPITFEANATVRPSDQFRFDAGISKSTFDSEDTLRIGLTTTQFGASVDYVPSELWTLSARANRATFSDGNRRSWAQVEVARRLVNSPRVTIGYRFTYFDFRLPNRPGYYTPDRFRTHEALLRAYGQFSQRVRWDLRLIGGNETETPGGDRQTINAGLTIAYRIGPKLEIEGAYDFSSSRTFAPGGFERNVARLTLRKRF